MEFAQCNSIQVRSVLLVDDHLDEYGQHRVVLSDGADKYRRSTYRHVGLMTKKGLVQSDLGHACAVFALKVTNRTEVKSTEVFAHRYGELVT